MTSDSGHSNGYLSHIKVKKTQKRTLCQLALVSHTLLPPVGTDLFGMDVSVAGGESSSASLCTSAGSQSYYPVCVFTCGFTQLFLRRRSMGSFISCAAPSIQSSVLFLCGAF